MTIASVSTGARSARLKPVSQTLKYHLMVSIEKKRLEKREKLQIKDQMIKNQF